MKILLLILSFTFINSTVYSQNGWFKQTGVFYNNVFDIYFFDENTGFICNSTGIYRTTDGGDNWSQVSNIISTIEDIDFVNNSLGFASGGESIYKTTDGGVTWENIYQFSIASHISDITTVDGNTVYVLLLHEKIYKSTDGGITFDTTYSYPLDVIWPFWDIYAFSNNTVLISGDGYIFKSNDGGDSWHKVFDDSTGWPTHIYPQSDGRIYAAVGNGEILLSYDKGSNWGKIYEVPRDTTMPATFHTIHFVKNIGYAIRHTLNSPNTLLAKSYNNGYNWHYSFFPTTHQLQELFFVDENIGWAGGEKSTLLKTVTGADASSFIYFKRKYNIKKIISDYHAIYDTITINTISSSSIMSTSALKIIDIKVTVDTIMHANSSELELSLIHLGVSDTLTYGLISAGANFIHTIFDDSASGNIISGLPPYTGTYRPYSPLSQFNNMELNGDWVLKVYDKATGNAGVLNAWGLEIEYIGNIVNVETFQNEIPNSFSLSQNYPNPFNPSTTIKYTIPNGVETTHRVVSTKLIVYDILGREVATLINQQQKPGNYEVKFNASNLTSGIYFYRLQIGNFAAAKKMLLLR